ncbi:hypothetical protein NDK47_23325 [Brevibacillus ruminantium]|uniref:PepSY domain-containing protein n=1 Tax=Brevibacillus ruminantium TaxID=2950604 RepID=A0ABY4WK42_9BACL|nr:hypothetical protein [Brevibacillus ruminantium]USG65021.1 hypothetical protein NDK47_23325 [Brevibacillus ruminantium]
MKKSLVSISLLALFATAAPTLSGMPFTAQAANPTPAPAEQWKTIAELDPKVVEAARQAMQALAEGKVIEMDEVRGANQDCWVLAAKNNRGTVLVTKDKGEIVSVRVKFTLDEINSELRKTFQNTLKELDPKKEFSVSEVERIKWEKENIWSFLGEKGYVSIDPQTGKVISANMSYSLQEVPPQVVQTAQQTLKALSGNQGSSLYPAVTLYHHPQEFISKVWAFRDAGGNYGVEIGADTGKAVSLDKLAEISGDKFVNQQDIPKVFAKPFYTTEKAIVAANPLVKKHFQLDLTGYSVAVQYDTYTFTKPGKPTVIGKINKNGIFWNFLATPENGLAK